MAINSNDDTLGIWEIIANDPYITKKLGFKPENIKRYKNSSDILTSENREIHIYNSTTEKTKSDIVRKMIYQIDFMVTSEDYNLANEAKDQTIALLQGRELKHFHVLELVSPGMILAVPPSHYGIAVRFSVNATVFNKIKTI